MYTNEADSWHYTLLWEFRGVLGEKSILRKEIVGESEETARRLVSEYKEKLFAFISDPSAWCSIPDAYDTAFSISIDYFI